MSDLPCLISYPLEQGLEVLKQLSHSEIELVYTNPVKLGLTGGERRIVAQRTDQNGKLTLFVAYEQIIS
jgi:hypothetical protein